MSRSTKVPLFCCLLMLPALAVAYSYASGPVPKGGAFPCPGKYCGRSSLNDTHWGDCGQCQRGFRVDNNSHSVCQKCEAPPLKYDWFFLAFHVLFVIILHWVAIDHAVRRRNFNKQVVALHLCALFEVAAAAIATLLLSEPKGSLQLDTCGVRQLSDWYSLFHNPTPNYETTLYCTQEVVFPFYTMVFMFYALCGVFMLFLRPWVSRRAFPRRGRSAILAALYFLPVLALLHAVAGGLIYWAYPYVVFVLSIISSATHFACQLDQSPRTLFKNCFRDSRNGVIVIGHWMLHSFGILAITQISDPKFHLSLLALVPVPSAFYIITAKFTDPAYVADV